MGPRHHRDQRKGVIRAPSFVAKLSRTLTIERADRLRRAPAYWPLDT